MSAAGVAFGTGTADAWVRRHRVAYEIAHHYEWLGGHKALVGLDVTLYAQAGGVVHDPGSDEAYAVWRGLWDRADDLVPPGASLDDWERLPFDASFRLRPETGLTPEVMLTLVLYAPPDAPAWEHDTRHEVEKKLEHLGIPARTWRGV